MPEFDATIEYRPIPDYPGYFADSEGVIWSTRLAWAPRGNSRRRSAHPLSGYLSASRYRFYMLWVGSRPINVSGGKLVLLAFIGPPPTPEHECAHENGIRTDNRPANLRWATPKENAQDRIGHGTQVTKDSHPSRKLTSALVALIRARYAAGGVSQTQLAEEYGVSQFTISAAIRRETWR